MEIVLLIASVGLFVAMFLCIRKEKRLSGFYSQIGVCGRWYAFFTADLLVMGALCAVAAPVLLVLNLTGALGEFGQDIAGVLPMLAAAALLFLPAGILLYRRAQKKCPQALRKRLLWDMIVIMIGASFRLSLFFMMFLFAMWWESVKPTAYEVDGQVYYAYPGSDDLYDAAGNKRGLLNSSHTKAVID